MNPEKSIPELTEKADKLFSEDIRKKDADETGFVKCCCCGVMFRWKDLDCGHYISRSKFAVRYDERNAHPQCRSCNGKHNDNPKPFQMYILKTYPAGTLTELNKLAESFTSALDKRFILNNVIKKYGKRKKV